MNNFMGHLMLLFSACVRICTRRLNKNLICRPKIIHLCVGRQDVFSRFYNCFVRNRENFRLRVESKMLLFSACVRTCTRRLNKNLGCFFKNTDSRISAYTIGFCLTAILLINPISARADTTVSFSRPTIGMGETAELIFSSDEPITAAPDMDEVSRYFRVSGQQMQEMTSIVNGQLSRSYQLVFNVRPLKIGKVTLDNLTLNGQKLKPVTLDVVQGATSFAGANAVSVKLQASANKKQVYVGDSFIYKLVLYDVAQIIDGQLLPPRVVDADMRQLGQDKVYRGVKDGKTVEMVERSFLVTPKSAGVLTLEPAVFDGTSRESLKAQRTPGELFDMGILFDGLANFGAPVSAHSDAVTVRVLPKPASWKGWWLPSSSVTLVQSFKMPDKFVVGRPIERTLTLQAAGVSAEKLPELTQPAGNGFKIYPSVPRRHTDESADGVSGYEELTVVLIPTKSGTLTIPPVEVPWFDTETGQTRLAKVPAETIRVEQDMRAVTDANIDTDISNGQNEIPREIPLQTDKPAAVANPSGQTQSFNQTVEDEKTAFMPNVVKPQMAQPDGNKSPSHDWLLILAGIFIGMSMAGLIMYFYIKRKEAKKKKPLPDLYPF